MEACRKRSAKSLLSPCAGAYGKETEENNAVPGDSGLEFILIYADVLLPPQVPHSPRAFDAQLRGANRYRPVNLIEIEQPDRQRAVLHRLGEDEHPVGPDDWLSLPTQSILINLDYLGVAEDIERKLVQPRHIAGVKQRSGHQTPHRHIAVLLVGRQLRGYWRLVDFMRVADVSDKDIIRVVPLARLCVLEVSRIAQADMIEARQICPTSQASITCGPPAMTADLPAPFPDLAHSILAQV